MKSKGLSVYELKGNPIISLGELLGAESGQGVSYSRRKLSYSRAKRYRGPDYTYATVLGSVNELVQEGWLCGHRVKPNNRGWQSSFWATPDLIQAAQEFAAAPTFEGREPSG